ncbi:MAG: hypothetical protein A3J79_05000 [Elusimicrobia bacterium RIFOXYB2_FULL_62_6]|nr:MAG: hypothetical protein A3J79_05000 [Elusimicrobia bacterium RIFOXYB2_FULL_62_6]
MFSIRKQKNKETKYISFPLVTPDSQARGWMLLRLIEGLQRYYMYISLLHAGEQRQGPGA